MKNLKPFDLQAALAGKAVMLRNGKKAYVRHHETELAVEYEDRLMGYDVTSGMLIGWGKHGNHMSSGGPNPFDIIGMYPETRIVNGFRVPVPETEELKLGCMYFAPHLQSDSYFARLSWDGDACDMRSLKRGVVFLNIEDAIANAKAMLGIDP